MVCQSLYHLGVGKSSNVTHNYVCLHSFSRLWGQHILLLNCFWTLVHIISITGRRKQKATERNLGSLLCALNIIQSPCESAQVLRHPQEFELWFLLDMCL